MTTLEIAITTLPEAIAAAQGGADSIEISYDLARDGLTPSLALVSEIRQAVAVDIHVIIRPTDRDFIYRQDEVDLIMEQTRLFAALPITGLVFGAHQANGQLDVGLITQVAKAAAGKPITLHRALDSAKAPEDGLRRLVGIIPRVLTSGPAATAWEGRDGLKAWVDGFGAEMAFIAAGKIRRENIAEIARYTGVRGCHVGSGAHGADSTVTADQVQQLVQAITLK